MLRYVFLGHLTMWQIYDTICPVEYLAVRNWLQVPHWFAKSAAARFIQFSRSPPKKRTLVRYCCCRASASELFSVKFLGSQGLHAAAGSDSAVAVICC
ncbi:CDK5RAP1-like protein [Actinidia chinensis var. chinensis]|uniref:CDK5RAP1-like protein n=1 Tax=Actinidia chinensis var. chinensis TaxID=1590841 RepID=A0A2R6QHG5_ACTCC|nr:CDK5RAP1-like protein [Actinidia chinensis var. chinensis]